MDIVNEQKAARNVFKVYRGWGNFQRSNCVMITIYG